MTGACGRCGWTTRRGTGPEHSTTSDLPWGHHPGAPRRHPSLRPRHRGYAPVHAPLSPRRRLRGDGARTPVRHLAGRVGRRPDRHRTTRRRRPLRRRRLRGPRAPSPRPPRGSSGLCGGVRVARRGTPPPVRPDPHGGDAARPGHLHQGRTVARRPECSRPSHVRPAPHARHGSVPAGVASTGCAQPRRPIVGVTPPGSSTRSPHGSGTRTGSWPGTAGGRLRRSRSARRAARPRW